MRTLRQETEARQDARAADNKPKLSPHWEEFLNTIKQRANPTSLACGGLPIYDPRDWQGLELPERDWFVEGLIPCRTVTNLTGDGGAGKTEIVLQLLASSALNIPWFGMTVMSGPCLYYGAEDEADELHRRFATIVDRAGKQLADLHGIRLIPMAERDAVLAQADKGGRIEPTALFAKLKAEALALRPSLIVIDPAADVFAGDEINRQQVRKFVSMLRALAIELDCAVLLLSHPSVSGMITGTGSSGSTGWRNSVRSRLYLTIPKVKKKPHPLKRIIQIQKANYSVAGDEIPIIWNSGIYVLDDGSAPQTESKSNEAADAMFIELLNLFVEQGQNLGVAPGTSYAPARMAKHPKAKGITKHDFAESMQRLLDAKSIKVVTEGPLSRRRSRLALNEK